MTPAKRAIVERNLALGRNAARILEATGELHAEREKQLITELIAWFSANPWDERVAIRYVAALAENKAQQDTLEYRARKGAEARAALFGGNTPQTAD